MTVIDRLRSALPGGEDADEATTGWTPVWDVRWLRGLLLGLATGVISALVVVVPVVLAWLVEPRATGSPWGAVGTGTALWLLTGGAHLTNGPVTISLVPLLGLLLLVVVARLGAREAMAGVPTDGEHWRGLVPAPLAATLGAWWGGYAVAVAIAARLSSPGPFGVSPLSLALPAVLVPLLAIAFALRPLVAQDPDVLGPVLDASRVPDSVRRGLRPGLRGATALLCVGALLVLVMVLLSWGEVTGVQAALTAGGFGSVILVVAQFSALPNLALWAVSFLAGPGFHVVEGGSTTWGGSTAGLMPMVPVFAALPQPNSFPWFTALSALVVVGVGAWVGRRSLDAVARLSRLRTKASVATAACLVCAVAIGILDVVAGGSLGQYRLASVGAPAALLTLAVFAELVVGAMAVVVRDAWRLRR
ncbi:MAG: DUF6350 family protein [Ornithinibacter sp.]